MPENPSCKPRSSEVSFAAEVKDLIRFLRHPRLTPRLPRQVGTEAWTQDWFGPVRLGRLMLWALVLWSINLFVFGPIAVAAAGAGGAQHRFNLAHIPWIQAVLWAPVVEELAFRYILRRPAQAFAVLPIALVCLFAGPKWYVQLLLVLSLYLIINRSAWPVQDESRQVSGSRLAAALQGRAWRWSSYKRYVLYFPWVFYGSTLAFAALHLYNFSLNAAPWYLLPLLVLPQAITGLVLGWMRVRWGIGSAILLHALFNAGPLMLVMLVLRLMPDLPT